MQDAVESVERMAYPRKYSDYVAYYADKYKLDENRVYAIIRTESGFSPTARSGVGALGLMQITEETFSWLTTKDVYKRQEVKDGDGKIPFAPAALASQKQGEDGRPSRGADAPETVQPAHVAGGVVQGDIIVQGGVHRAGAKAQGHGQQAQPPKTGSQRETQQRGGRHAYADGRKFARAQAPHKPIRQQA